MDKLIIGLTGQSGAGKSTASFVFENEGFYVINADRVSRMVTMRKDVLDTLKKTFGNVLLESGMLDRRALAKIVFSDKEKLQLLNSILFPIITSEIQNIIDEIDCKYILLDAPQLFESGADKQCHKIVSVIAPKEKLIERAMERDGISHEDAEKRLNSQFPEDFFKEKSDYIITNDTTIDNLIKQTKQIVKEIMQ